MNIAYPVALLSELRLLLGEDVLPALLSQLHAALHGLHGGRCVLGSVASQQAGSALRRRQLVVQRVA